MRSLPIKTAVLENHRHVVYEKGEPPSTEKDRQSIGLDLNPDRIGARLHKG